MKAEHAAEYALAIGKYYCHLQFANMCGVNTTVGVILQIILEVFSFHRPCSVWNLVRSGSSKSLSAFYCQS